MNTQEKKVLKLRLKKAKQEAKKKQKLQGTTTNIAAPVGKNAGYLPLSLHQVPSASNKRYHHLKLSTSALEEELADLRGDRDGVPPVMASPPMAQEAFRMGVLEANGADSVFDTQPQIVLDDDLASRWAFSLKNNMKSAEHVRCKEEMRPMPYQLIPEVWTRLRPDSLSTVARNVETASSKVSIADANEHGARQEQEKSNGVWSFMTVRHRWERADDDIAIVLSILHRHSNLHVSCGAKFGCDFLLYDGRRDQRHAFAGLRVVERSSAHLTLPSAYDLTGFVRCLNTAGKLALLATVEHDESCARVAFVDLALEKVLSDSPQTHGRLRETKKTRRDVGKNLSKHC
jgi:tRNA splicing endonuclease